MKKLFLCLLCLSALWANASKDAVLLKTHIGVGSSEGDERFKNAIKEVEQSQFESKYQNLQNFYKIRDEFLESNTVFEINSLRNELLKYSIFSDVFVNIDYEKFKNELKNYSNYAILLVDTRGKKISVISDLGLNFSSVTNYYYLKFGFLPSLGAILPLIADASKSEQINAALLNGYIELVSLIADEKNFEIKDLPSGINQSIFNAFRLIFYALILIFLIKLLRRKRAKK